MKFVLLIVLIGVRVNEHTHARTINNMINKARFSAYLFEFIIVGMQSSGVGRENEQLRASNNDFQNPKSLCFALNDGSRFILLTVSFVLENLSHFIRKCRY